MVTAIQQISRPKLSGLPGMHHGVRVTQGGGDIVFDLDARDGLRSRSLTQFLQGRAGSVIRTVVDPRGIAEARHRIASATESPDSDRYNLLTSNCEHFANLVVAGRRVSRQVDAVVFVALIGGLILLLRKADADA